MLAEREGKRKQGRLGERIRWVQKERDGPKKHGQTLVTRGTVLGTSHSGTEKRTVLSWIRGLLLNLFLCSQFELTLRGVFGTETHDAKNAH